ncbi:hypothetical protein [Nocardia terpenica]|nr:hypothetical protein [Nocardia terpenica]
MAANRFTGAGRRLGRVNRSTTGLRGSRQAAAAGRASLSGS